MRLLASVAVLWLLVLASPAWGEVRRYVAVSYDLADGSRSEPRLREVEFLTGTELERRVTGNIPTLWGRHYEARAVYALIWFGQGEVAILKLQQFVPLVEDVFGGREFFAMFAFTDAVDAVQVNAEEGDRRPRERRWRIWAKYRGEWFDPRAARERW